MGQVKRAGAVAVALLMAISGSALADARAGAAFPNFEIQTSTNRGGDSNVLNDVSCASPGFCVAVGAYADFSFPQTKPEGTLIEVWANGKWSTKASPGQGGRSRLNGVSCPTTTRCYAVGESHSSTAPLMVTWTGGAWIQVVPPVGADPGDLEDIDCTDATHCVAVGTRAPNGTGPLVLELEGSTWSVATLPAVGDGRLYDVSCPTAGACVAVGYRIGTGGVGRSLALHLSGGTWSKVTAPNRTDNDNRWYGVSCATASRCTAVGSSSMSNGRRRTLEATFAAGAWTLVRESSLAEWFAIDCTAVFNCTSAGAQGGHAILESRAAPPNVGLTTGFAAPSVLVGIDCITRSICVAVGGLTSDPFRARTFVVRSH
jgi:hypothetical protein